MNDQQWLEALRRELDRRGVPRAESARLVCELAEHLLDLKEETMSDTGTVEAVLGTPREVACAAVAARGEPSWMRRAAGWLGRFFAFVLLPVPALAIAWWGAIVAIDQLREAWETWTGSSSEEAARFAFQDHPAVGIGVLLAVGIATASVVTFCYGLAARRTRVSWPWPLVTTILVTLCVASLFLDVQYTGIPGQNQLNVGLGFHSSPAWTDLRWLRPFVQGALPLLTGLWFVRSLWRERRGAVELSA